MSSVVLESKMFVKWFCFSFIVAVTYAGRSPLEIKHWLLSQSLECTKDNTLNSKELQMLLNHELPGTKHTNCFLACIFKKVEWMNEKGEFDSEKGKEIMGEEYADNPKHKENAEKIFDTCKKVNEDTVSDGASGCDRAKLLAQCLIDYAPKMGFNLDVI